MTLLPKSVKSLWCAKADHKLSLLLVPSFLRGVRLTLDVDASVGEGVKTTEMGRISSP